MSEQQNPETQPDTSSENDPFSGQNTGAESAGERAKAASGQELIDELTRLGQKFVEVVEVAWNSEQRKKAEHDLRVGLEHVATSLEDGIKRVSSTKEAKEFVGAAEDVAGKVRSSKIASELSGALAEGLRTLSEQMDKLATDMKKRSPAEQSTTTSGTPPPPPPESGAQDIPISHEDQV
jgi:hypothetical protein